MFRPHALALITGFVATLAASACSSGGGGAFIALEGPDSGDNATEKTDARVARDAARRDAGGGEDEEDDAAVPAAKDGGGQDAKDARVDVVDGAPLEDQCFDVTLGQARAIVKPSVGDVKISEWMPDPTAVTDANGEWVELRATSAFDLNGIQVGTTSLGAGYVAADCVHVAAGGSVLLAHSTDGSINGLNGAKVDVVMSTFIVNANGTLKIGVDDVVLDTVTWATSDPGKSIMIDSVGKQCVAPASVGKYNGTDVGSPRAANSACP